MPVLKADVWPPFVFLDQTHTRGEFANDFRRAIGRAVIHHKNFHLCARKILFQDAHHRFLYVALVIVSVD
jgi:hypothetical protein